MNIRYLNKLFVFLFLIGIGVGQKTNWSYPVYVQGYVKFGHDSNPLRLSDDEIVYTESDSNNLLTNGSASVSSNFLSLYSKLTYSPKLINGRTSKFSFSLKHNFYVEQSERTNSSININVNQSIGGYKNLYCNYFLMPDYYLREYRDNDMIFDNYENVADSLESSYFTTEKIKLGYQYPINKNKEKFSFELVKEKQIFNDLFTEFDLDINGLGVKYYNQFFSIYYGYTVADNITFLDGNFSTSYMDRGYNQHQFSFNYSKKIKHNNSFGISANLYHRIYISDIYNDTLHRTRKHNDLSISAWYNHTFLGYKSKVTFTNRNRVTNSSFDWVEDLKTFQRFNLSYTIYFNKSKVFNR